VSLQTLTILPEVQTSKRRSRKPAGRCFSAQLLGHLLLRNSDGTSPATPAWIALLASDAELRPFVANVQAGKTFAGTGRNTFALPKASGYRWLWQKVPTGSAAVAYRPDLFHLDPTGPLPSVVNFILAPDAAWLEQQARDLLPYLPDPGVDPRDAARAALLAAFLDRRSPVPILRDLRFHLRLYRAALENGSLRPASGDRYTPLTSHNTDTLRLDDPAGFSLAAAELQELLVTETQAHFREHPMPRRALPAPPPLPPLRPLGFVPKQLGLDFGLPALSPRPPYPVLQATA
jgi:hypothetical protein